MGNDGRETNRSTHRFGGISNAEREHRSRGNREIGRTVGRNVLTKITLRYHRPFATFVEIRSKKASG